MDKEDLAEKLAKLKRDLKKKEKRLQKCERKLETKKHVKETLEQLQQEPRENDYVPKSPSATKVTFQTHHLEKDSSSQNNGQAQIFPKSSSSVQQDSPQSFINDPVSSLDSHGTLKEYMNGKSNNSGTKLPRHETAHQDGQLVVDSENLNPSLPLTSSNPSVCSSDQLESSLGRKVRNRRRGHQKHRKRPLVTSDLQPEKYEIPPLDQNVLDERESQFPDDEQNLAFIAGPSLFADLDEEDVIKEPAKNYATVASPINIRISPDSSESLIKEESKTPCALSHTQDEDAENRVSELDISFAVGDTTINIDRRSTFLEREEKVSPLDVSFTISNSQPKSRKRRRSEANIMDFSFLEEEDGDMYSQIKSRMNRRKAEKRRSLPSHCFFGFETQDMYNSQVTQTEESESQKLSVEGLHTRSMPRVGHGLSQTNTSLNQLASHKPLDVQDDSVDLECESQESSKSTSLLKRKISSSKVTKKNKEISTVSHILPQEPLPVSPKPFDDLVEKLEGLMKKRNQNKEISIVSHQAPEALLNSKPFSNFVEKLEKLVKRKPFSLPKREYGHLMRMKIRNQKPLDGDHVSSCPELLPAEICLKGFSPASVPEPCNFDLPRSQFMELMTRKTNNVHRETYSCSPTLEHLPGQIQPQNSATQESMEVMKCTGTSKPNLADQNDVNHKESKDDLEKCTKQGESIGPLNINQRHIIGSVQNINSLNSPKANNEEFISWNQELSEEFSSSFAADSQSHSFTSSDNTEEVLQYCSSIKLPKTSEPLVSVCCESYTRHPRDPLSGSGPPLVVAACTPLRVLVWVPRGRGWRLHREWTLEDLQAECVSGVLLLPCTPRRVYVCCTAQGVTRLCTGAMDRDQTGVQGVWANRRLCTNPVRQFFLPLPGPTSSLVLGTVAECGDTCLYCVSTVTSDDHVSPPCTSDDHVSPPCTSVELEDCGSAVLSVCAVSGLQGAVVGADRHFIYVWNHQTGVLLRTIDVDVKIQSCPSVHHVAGLLFVSVVTDDDTETPGCLLTVNPTSGRSTLVHCWDWPPGVLLAEHSPRLQSMTSSGSYLCGRTSGGLCVLWPAGSGRTVAYSTEPTEQGLCPVTANKDRLVVVDAGGIRVYRLRNTVAA